MTVELRKELRQLRKHLTTLETARRQSENGWRNLYLSSVDEKYKRAFRLLVRALMEYGQLSNVLTKHIDEYDDGPDYSELIPLSEDGRIYDAAKGDPWISGPTSPIDELIKFLDVMIRSRLTTAQK